MTEQIACKKIAKRYDAEYSFGELHEGFYIYDLDKSPHEGKKVIFAGATKLPSNDDRLYSYNVIIWWLGCLHEIADALRRLNGKYMLMSSPSHGTRIYPDLYK